MFRFMKATSGRLDFVITIANSTVVATTERVVLGVIVVVVFDPCAWAAVTGQFHRYCPSLLRSKGVRFLPSPLTTVSEGPEAEPTNETESPKSDPLLPSRVPDATDEALPLCMLGAESDGDVLHPTVPKSVACLALDVVEPRPRGGGGRGIDAAFTSASLGIPTGKDD